MRINVNALFATLILLSVVFFSQLSNAQVRIYNPNEQINLNGNAKNFRVKLVAKSMLSNLQSLLHNSTRDSLIYAAGETFTITVDTKKNVKIDVETSEVTSLSIFLTRVDTININGTLKENVFLHKAAKQFAFVNTVQINTTKVKEINFQDLEMNSFIARKSDLLCLNLKNAAVKKTFLLGQVRLDSANFYLTELPQFITLDSVDVKIDGIIDLSKLKHIKKNTPYVYELERTMRISDTDFDKFKLVYDRWNFHVDTLQGIQRQNWIYEKMLKRFADAGLTSKHEYYLYQLNQVKNAISHGQIRNWINEFWWNNGTNKTKAVVNSVMLFFIFFLFNCVFYKKLEDVYMPDTFKDYHDMVKNKYRNRTTGTFLWCSNVLGTFIYTSYVFWGLRLDFPSLRIRCWWLFLMLILQYIVGLVCVAYIISFIIVR